MNVMTANKLSRFIYITDRAIQKQRNEAIAGQVRSISQNHVNREYEINDFATTYDIPSQLESAVMRYPEVHGGSGLAAAAVQDLGLEPTLGATGSGADTAKRRARKKVIEVSEGLSAAGISAGGVSGGGAGAIGEGISGGAKPH